MKTLKKVFAVGLVAAFASAGFAVQAGAEHTEPRFTLEIDPSQGLPGQTINAQVPPEYQEECSGVGNPINVLLTEALTALIEGEADVEQAAAVLLASLEDPDLEGLLESVLFPLLFVDPATEDPVSEPGADFWDQFTGQGTIVAPGTGENPDGPFFNEPLPRPEVYIVAAACLGLNLDLDLELLLDTLLEPLQEILEPIAAQVAAFVTACVVGGGDIEECTAQGEALFAELVEADPDVPGAIAEIVGGVLGQLIDDDPEVAWVAPFCLLGGDGVVEDCEVPAEPIEAPVTFAG